MVWVAKSDWCLRIFRYQIAPYPPYVCVSTIFVKALHTNLIYPHVTLLRSVQKELLAAESRTPLLWLVCWVIISLRPSPCCRWTLLPLPPFLLQTKPGRVKAPLGAPFFLPQRPQHVWHNNKQLSVNKCDQTESEVIDWITRSRVECTEQPPPAVALSLPQSRWGHSCFAETELNLNCCATLISPPARPQVYSVRGVPTTAKVPALL